MKIYKINFECNYYYKIFTRYAHSNIISFDNDFYTIVSKNRYKIHLGMFWKLNLT